MTELTFSFAGTVWRLGGAPKVMGVVNVTPDSFSDGGAFLAVDRAVEHGMALVAEGADILDIGGESTRPGAPEVPEDEEIRRVCPVIAALAAQTGVPISIDTRKSRVAEAALAAGAKIVNDVSGLTFDPRLAEVVAASGAGYVGMHMRGTPETMQSLTRDDDIMVELTGFFRQLIRTAVACGIARDRIAIDPGIGFGKTAGQNLAIIHELGRFRELDRPLLIGVSRKAFIGKTLKIDVPSERIWGTAAAVALAVYHGAHIIRVHDVGEMKQVGIMAAAIREAVD